MLQKLEALTRLIGTKGQLPQSKGKISSLSFCKFFHSSLADHPTLPFICLPYSLPTNGMPLAVQSNMYLVRVELPLRGAPYADRTFRADSVGSGDIPADSCEVPNDDGN